MTNLSTTNIPASGGGVKKTLDPGNHTCKINSVELIPFTFIEGAYELRLNVVGPDMGPDFDGFWVNKDDQSLGKHKGQSGRVKASEWAFADSVTKGGTKISRDTEIMKWLNSFCEAIGKKDWLTAQDNKHATIESLVNAFAIDKPFKGMDINFCLAGKEYLNKENYVNHDLFLPKFSKDGVPFELPGVAKSKLAKYDPAKHIVKKKAAATVNNFTDGSTTGNADNSAPGTSADFEL